jgi:hypothetical protein
VSDSGLLDLRIDLPIFIGFKANPDLKIRLESLSEANRPYFSGEDSKFLRLCRVGDDVYVGKLIHEPLTTDRVDDIRRNVLSILRRIGTEVRLPVELKIFACSAA